MKNRRLFLCVPALALALCLLTTACAAPASQGADLQERGLTMVAQMDALASSEAYVRAMSASAELGDLIAAMGAGDYATPTAVYRLSVPEDAVQKLMFGDESADLSAALMAWMQGKACAAIPTQLAARSGASMLAAVSCVTYAQALVCKDLAAPVLYLYQYESAYSAMAVFVPGVEGAVSATACFVPTDDALRAASSAQDVAAWISDALGYMQVTAEKIS